MRRGHKKQPVALSDGHTPRALCQKKYSHTTCFFPFPLSLLHTFPLSLRSSSLSVPTLLRSPLFPLGQPSLSSGTVSVGVASLLGDRTELIPVSPLFAHRALPLALLAPVLTFLLARCFFRSRQKCASDCNHHHPRVYKPHLDFLLQRTQMEAVQEYSRKAEDVIDQLGQVRRLFQPWLSFVTAKETGVCTDLVQYLSYCSLSNRTSQRLHAF